MLANHPILAPSGTLGKDVHPPASFLNELLTFIANELPRWRDRPDRKAETAETILTSQLCAHLNSAARHSVGWDILQFRTEETDERRKDRKIDLVPAPCGTIVWIEGRGYTDFDALMPIECKRLPTPKGNGRDEWEYVINRQKSTGGIQRFKAGHHGAAHTLGAMIGYVQEGSATLWHKRVTGWIGELVKSETTGWTQKDQLKIENNDRTLRLVVIRSSHDRENGTSIALRHLWLEMN